MSTTICENIKILRKQKNVTQEKLAESLGVTPQAISRWESGAGYPAIDYLPDLAAFFEISVDELLGVKLSKREARRWLCCTGRHGRTSRAMKRSQT